MTSLITLSCHMVAALCVTLFDAASYAASPGKEALMITIGHEPGGSAAIHRHKAHVFVYVPEGAIKMQVKNQPEVTLKAGQTFYETPKDIHVVGKNASVPESAMFLVFLIKKTVAPPVLPVK